MPKFEIGKSDLEKLVGRSFSIRELEDEALLYAKAELDGADGDTLKVDVKDTNRPDLWSAEGIAREIKGRFRREEGLPRYLLKKPSCQVIVESSKEFHPLATAAIVRNVKMDKHILSQMIQLQEKIAGTLGRNRRSMSLGAYDMSKFRFPVKYVGRPLDSIKFRPLGFEKELTARQILEVHEKGKQYAHLLKGVKKCNVWIDAKNNILAMEPITNSDEAGNVTLRTRDVFLECTGNNIRHLHTAITVLATALAERGGQIEGVEVVYKDKKIITPDLTPKKAHLDPGYCRKMLGLEISDVEMVKLLKEARYDARLDGKRINCQFPSYRQDIMHQRDIVEDVAISFGYNDIMPEPPALATIGVSLPLEEQLNAVREACVGLRLQEILSFTLTSRENAFRKMNLPEAAIEIENPVSSSWSIFRNSLLPGLLEFFSKNKNQDYPQHIFEVGDVMLPDSLVPETGVQQGIRLAVALTNTVIGYESVSSLLSAFLSSFGVSFSLQKSSHPSFLSGRAAAIIVKNKVIGVVGEIHPQILNNWSLEKPVAAFEIDLQQILFEGST